MLNLDDLTYKIRLDDSEVERVAARTTQQMQRLGTAVTPARQEFAQLTANTKLTRQEMLALNYTLSDVAASLASGASPWTILLQQGGQVKDTFGGIGPLFSKLGSFITVGRVAVGGLAAALGTLGYAFVKGFEESDRFEKSVARTGNAAGLTAGQFNQLAADVARNSGATTGSAREILQLLVETGQVGPQAIGEVATAAAALAKATGRTEAEVVKDFAGMSNGVAKWAMEHNRSMNFITAEQYKYIRALEASGKVTEAQIYTSKLVEQASARVTQNLGFLETAWNGVKGAASAAWDGMLGLGRSETLDQQLAKAQKALADYQQRGMQNPFKLRDLKGDVKTLQEAVAIEREQAAKQGADAEKNRKEIEQQQRAAVEASLQIERSQFGRSQAYAELAREKERIAVERAFDQQEMSYSAYVAARVRLDRAALTAKEAAINEEIALEQRRVVEKPEDKIAQTARITDLETKRVGILRERAQLEERIRRGDVVSATPASQTETAQQQFVRFERQQQAELEKSEQARRTSSMERASELVAGNRELGIALIKDDRERAIAQLDLEEETLRKRLDLATMSAEDRKRVEGDLATWRSRREELLTEQLKPEYQKRLELFADFNRHMKEASDDFRAGFIESGRDQFRTWVETGKISANTITSYIRRKFADLVYDQFLAGIFDQFGKSIFGFLTGFGGGGGLTVDTGGIGITSAGASLASFGLGAGRASGGDVRRGSFQPVNEFGNELLTVRGKDYLMMGADFGRVTPAGGGISGAGGKTQVIDASTHIGSVGAGVNPGEMRAYVRNENAKMELKLRRLIANDRA